MGHHPGAPAVGVVVSILARLGLHPLGRRHQTPAIRSEVASSLPRTLAQPALVPASSGATVVPDEVLQVERELLVAAVAESEAGSVRVSGSSHSPFYRPTLTGEVGNA
jgi:hypothetical protein